ncbi:MAG TPA: ComEA family DNA-binding protein [Egibacteraceae bacterium]|nr:ComEA family DNA-binding protein [Egibacteraceae bacterium]
MREDGVLGAVRSRLAAPLAPLQGLALLAVTAVGATALLGRLTQAPAEQPPPQVEIRDEPVVVHVAGHVRSPGLYRLPGGSRVADAVAAAGGATEHADLDGLNLARVVEDGEQLLVPAAGAPGSPERAGVRPDGKVDLNRATAAELDALPGIGPVLAARIVAYRERHGGFRTVRDLRRVQGIGEKLYGSLAELVAV